MRVWLETVPALLRRLDVKHVAMVTHSAGAVYTLNTLIHHRSLLDPDAPYVAFLGSCPRVGSCDPLLHNESDNKDSAVCTLHGLGRIPAHNGCQATNHFA